MEKDASKITYLQPDRIDFYISICHQENHSWQGFIQRLDNGKTIHFRSELELIGLLNEAAVSTKNTSDEKLRNWMKE